MPDMRKQLIGQEGPGGDRWFDLDARATVEITSEDAAHPIEHALSGRDTGWRASTPGEQVIRLHFDEPTTLRVIEVRFEEREATRTQEFVLRWSPDAGRSYRDIVRQQYTFASQGATRQAERYAVDIQGMTTLELRVVPDISGGDAVASLSQLRLA
jgi:hypothetical protein